LILERVILDTVNYISPETCFGRCAWSTWFRKLYHVLGYSRFLKSSSFRKI